MSETQDLQNQNTRQFGSESTQESCAERQETQQTEKTENQSMSLFEQIGGLGAIQQVVDKIYEQSVQEYDLQNIRNCTPKRIELLKKRQVLFLKNLLGGQQSEIESAKECEEDVQIAHKRNNQQNFEFFKRVLISAFEKCGFDSITIQKVENQLANNNNNNDSYC